ncbi:MAG: Mg2+ transporter protein, CorA family protein, partial [Deltaproteobacteria bacterium]|nr:Mg2+ transporter protein, CorA family protein [Deltaproteobacteria bacterium]
MTVKRVQELLAQQRLPEGSAPAGDKGGAAPAAHLPGELRALLASLEPAAVAGILDRLSPEDVVLAWSAIADDRQDEILHEVLDSTRDALAARSGYLNADSVVNAFELIQGRLVQTTIESVDDLAEIKPLWVDLVGTTEADRRKIGQYFGLELPDPEDLTDIETSARFYVEEETEIHLH